MLSIADVVRYIKTETNMSGVDLYKDPVYRYLPSLLNVRLLNRDGSQGEHAVHQVPTLGWLMLTPDRFRSTLEVQMAALRSGAGKGTREASTGKRKRDESPLLSSTNAAISSQSARPQQISPLDMMECRQWMPEIELEGCEVDSEALSVIADIACHWLGGHHDWPKLEAGQVVQLLRAAAYLDSDVLLQSMDACLPWERMDLDKIISVIVPAALLKRPRTPSLQALAAKLFKLDTTQRGMPSLEDLTYSVHFSSLIETLLRFWPHPGEQILKQLLVPPQSGGKQGAVLLLVLLCNMSASAHTRKYDCSRRGKLAGVEQSTPADEEGETDVATDCASAENSIAPPRRGNAETPAGSCAQAESPTNQCTDAEHDERPDDRAETVEQEPVTSGAKAASGGTSTEGLQPLPCPLCRSLVTFHGLLARCGQMLFGERRFLLGREWSVLSTKLMLAGANPCSVTAHHVLNQVMLQMVEAQPSSSLPWSRISVRPDWAGQPLRRNNPVVAFAEPGAATVFLKMNRSQNNAVPQVCEPVEFSGVWGSCEPRWRFSMVARDPEVSASLPELSQWWTFRYTVTPLDNLKITAQLMFAKRGASGIKSPHPRVFANSYCKVRTALLGTKAIKKLEGDGVRAESAALLKLRDVTVRADHCVEQTVTAFVDDPVIVRQMPVAELLPWVTEDESAIIAIFFTFGDPKSEGSHAPSVLPLLSSAVTAQRTRPL